MGRSRIARALIEGLIRKKEECEKREKVLKEYLQKLHEKYLKQEIPYSDYIEILHKKTDGRNIHDWIEYYEEYIKNCEEGIKKHKRKLISRNIPVYFLAFIFIGFLISFIFYIAPTFIGFLIQEPTQEFTETLNLQFSQSEGYEWNLKNIGQLTSVKLSGSIEGRGNIKVYLDNLLIVDNSGISAGTSSGKEIISYFISSIFKIVFELEISILKT